MVVAPNVQIALSGHAQATARSLYAAGAFARGGEAGAKLFVSANGLQVSSAECHEQTGSHASIANHIGW